MSSPPQDRPPFRGMTSVIVVAMALGVSLGFLDLALCLRNRPPELRSFGFALHLMSTAAMLFFVAFVLAWLLASRLLPLQRRHPVPLMSAIAMFFAVWFLLASLNKSFTLSSESIRKLVQIEGLLALLSGLSIAVIAYFVIERLQRSRYWKATLAMVSSIPFVVMQVAILEWMGVYQARFHSFPIPFGIAQVVAAAGILVVMHWVQRKTAVFLQVGVFLVCILLFPLTSLTKDYANAARPHPREVENSARHVLLITVDTLRSDFLSSYDAAARETPGIDALAHDGVRFEHAISPSSWTKPAIASILTGLPPTVHGVLDVKSRLSEKATTLAEHLLKHGYLTAAIVRNPFLGLSSNFSQGFLSYELVGKSDYYRGMNSLGATVLSMSKFTLWLSKLPDEPRDERGQIWTPMTTEMALSWLDANHRNPFFLWVHYFDPHAPYSPPPRHRPRENPPPSMGTYFEDQEAIRRGDFIPTPHERQWLRKLYGGEVADVDENVGRLVAKMKELGIYDDALVILTSDHGEEFWEHGGFEHGHSLYEEVIRVPLIFKLPSAEAGGARRPVIADRVSTEAIAPTVLNLAGISLREDHFRSGSLRRLWRDDPSGVPEKPLFSSGILYGEQREALVFEGFKYVRFESSGREELFDLRTDPGENLSMASSSPEALHRGRELLEQHGKTSGELRKELGLVEEEAEMLDEGTMRLLESLGYVK